MAAFAPLITTQLGVKKTPIRYAVSGEPMHHALCHCTDCSILSNAIGVGRISRGQTLASLAATLA